MRQYLFHTVEDWYTAQRILGHLNISYNSYIDEEDNGKFIIEVLA